MIVRQWEIVMQLSRRRRGMTVHQLSEATGASRATVYRDLKLLIEAGAPVTTERVTGEVRYQMLGTSYPPLMPTPLQVAALHLARRMMTPLAGTRLVAELEQLLARFSPTAQPLPTEPLSLGPPAASARPRHVKAVDQAIRHNKRIAFAYQSADQPTSRLRRADPISLRLHDGQLYLIAHDIERQDMRTFKLARVRDIEILDQPAAPHPEYDEQALFAYSAKVWTGAPVHVTVRLSAHVARFASEWPLAPTQILEPQPDGSVIVHADVAGTVEAMRWVLRWGEGAEALSPPELRRAVHEQLASALERYAD
jgi:predicted DNA-binding transcriptional regulator YafY